MGFCCLCLLVAYHSTLWKYIKFSLSPPTPFPPPLVHDSLLNMVIYVYVCGCLCISLYSIHPSSSQYLDGFLQTAMAAKFKELNLLAQMPVPLQTKWQTNDLATKNLEVILLGSVRSSFSERQIYIQLLIHILVVWAIVVQGWMGGSLVTAFVNTTEESSNPAL